MATDIVIPLGSGSRHNNMELKYALRGIEKHLTCVGNVYIIGENPGLNNVIHIPKKDSPKSSFRENNIYEKLILACKTEQISDNFLYFNDDHFLLSDFVASEFPCHYKYTLTESLKTKKGTYKISIKHTLDLMRKHALPYKDFDTHCPMLINKADFLRVMPAYDWSKRFGYVIKSVYCNSLKISGEQYPDMKMNEQYSMEQLQSMINGRLYFSIGDGAVNDDLILLLESLYPDKSKYEV